MLTESYAHRKAQTVLNILLPDGRPAVKQAVRISQTRHEFLFGCGGFDAVELAGGNPDGTPLNAQAAAFLEDRLQKIFSVCNYATLPFYWGRYEAEEGKTDWRRVMAAARWYAERGITTKGHPLCWHTSCVNWLMNYPNGTILEKQLARIKREVNDFKGIIDRWDVINEAVIMPVFDKYDNAVTRICKELGRTGIIKEVFAAAKQANPHAVFLINDFNTSPEYKSLIEDCLAAEIPVDAIGIQSHQHQGYWGREKLDEILERFSCFNIPLHWTENTIISGELMPAHIVDLNDWQVDQWPTTPEGEERQARELIEFYETLFAHPAVKAITTWDATDGKWLGAPSGLLRKDNTPKPAYYELDKKINGEWRTQAALLSGEKGELNFCGFRGDYTITLDDLRASFTLDGKQSEITIKLPRRS